MDWDDYRLVLSIARQARVADAASDLGVTASTVFRRLSDLEAALGVPLFHRERGQYRVTETGARLTAAAERMEQAAVAALREAEGQDQCLRGNVTIAASEVLAPFFLARHVGRIGAAHPELGITVLSGNRILSLAHLEADVALRPQRPSDPALFGRKLATIRWALYGAEPRSDDCQHTVQKPDIGFSSGRFAEWMAPKPDAFGPDTGAQFRCDSLIVGASLAVNTGSTVQLPMLLGDQWPGLHRLSAPSRQTAGELWIVCHEDMRKNARVRAVFDGLIEAARIDRALFEGT